MNDAAPVEPIAEMARAAAALARSGRSIREMNDGTPNPGSQASEELDEWSTAGNDPDQLSEGYYFAVKSLMAAEDCLLTLEAIAHKPDRFVAASAVARTALEASAQARRLADLDIDGTERARRFMRLTRNAHSESSGVVAFLRIEDEAILAKLSDIDRKVNEFATRQGGLGKNPTRLALIAELLSDLGFEDERGPRMAYVWLSSLAHAAKLGIDNAIPGQFPDALDRKLLFGLPEWFIWAVAFSYALATDRLVQLMGWDLAIWREAAVEFTERVRAPFSEVAAVWAGSIEADG